MRLIILIVLILNIYYNLQAQIVTPEYILSGSQKEVSDYYINNLEFYQTALPVDFNSYEITDTSIINELKWKSIYKIELIYTAYKESEKFSQYELNKKRILELQKHLPTIFDMNNIEWELIAQTKASNRVEADNQFHGFVFHTREPYLRFDTIFVKIGTEEEIDLIHYMLGDTLPLNYKSSLPIPIKTICDTIVTTTITEPSIIISEDIMYVPRLKWKEKRGILYSKKSIWNRKEYIPEGSDKFSTGETRIDTIIDCYGSVFERSYSFHKFTMDEMTRHSFFRDSVVSFAFNIISGKDIMVVEDVTGSMYPYLTQTFLWRRLNLASTNLNQFTFFNDGDRNPDGPIGKSYGMYYVKSDSVDAVEKTARATMRKGNGGAGPENDIEAMIRSLEFADNIKRIVLVADNNSSVRDLQLFDQLINKKIPIDVIVCGARNGKVNYQYLDIVRKTSGVAYTIEDGIINLSALSEGKTVEVGGQKFIIRYNNLILIR